MRVLTIFVNIFPSGGGYAYLQNIKSTQSNSMEQRWRNQELQQWQPNAGSSRLRKVRGRVRPLEVLSTQPFSVFLQEVAGASTIKGQPGARSSRLCKV
jgi:hypothetical protein